MNVVAILDVGKTNKKIILFDEQYRMVWEQSCVVDETKDEDGESCEDLQALTKWAQQSLAVVSALPDVSIRAVNFSAYGASLVHIGEKGQPVAPLYNYLKPFPEALAKKFYTAYGGKMALSMLTASPVLGSLNSGMQLYRIKRQQPELFACIHYSLHLPQYLSYLFTGKAVSEITSIGCHTGLWNFSRQEYHEWVYREGWIDKLAPIAPSTSIQPLVVQGDGGAGAGGGATVQAGSGRVPVVGVGLHDSSAAMIPYLESFRDPFVLISTGTWCISMNPFNDLPLTTAELQRDCLCYMSYLGRPVKASRLFAGYDHERQVQRLAGHFHRSPAYATTIAYDPAIVARLRMVKRSRGIAEPGGSTRKVKTSLVTASVFGQRGLEVFDSFEQAYHCLLMDIMDQQVASTGLVLRGTDVRRIFVDGGFGRNEVYMHLLAEAFPDIEVFAASVPQATAMGAALAIHSHWNRRKLPGDIIELKYYK